MLSFNFLNFFFQSFVKCSSKSKDNKKKGNALAETRTVFVMVVEKKREKKNGEQRNCLHLV